MPGLKALTHLISALYNYKASATTKESPIGEDGMCLRFDATYGGAKCLGVKTSEGWVKVAYCLGSVLGKSGCVLNTDFMASESESELKRVFQKVFSQMDEPPVFIFVDDPQKWDRLLRTWVEERWGTEAGRNVIIGLDAMHFKMQLLSSVDESHGDYASLNQVLERFVGQILGYVDPPFKDAASIQEALKKIFMKYSTENAICATLAKGKRFVNGATWGLGLALANAIANGNGENFDFDVEGLERAIGTKGILAGDGPRGVWECILNKDSKYFEYIFANCLAVAQLIVPGTSIDEGWHNYLKRYLHMHGRKGMELAQIEINMCKTFFNFAVKGSLHEGRQGKAQDSAVLDGPLRVKKTRILRKDHRARALAEESFFAVELGQWYALHVSMKHHIMQTITPQSLKRDGYAVRKGPKAPMSESEKTVIQEALLELRGPNGRAAMGRYEKIPRWIARVRLNGTRTENAVAEYIRSLTNSFLKKRRVHLAIGTSIGTTEDVHRQRTANAQANGCRLVASWLGGGNMAEETSDEEEGGEGWGTFDGGDAGVDDVSGTLPNQCDEMNEDEELNGNINQERDLDPIMPEPMLAANPPKRRGKKGCSWVRTHWALWVDEDDETPEVFPVMRGRVQQGGKVRVTFENLTWAVIHSKDTFVHKDDAVKRLAELE